MKHLAKIICAISVLVCLVAGLYCWINPIVENLEIHHDVMTLEVYDSRDISYSIYPSSIKSECYIVCSSSNENVAVSYNDTIYAKSVGTATITLKAYNKGQTNAKMATFDVVVNPKPVSSISLETEFTTIQVGKSAQITSQVLPYNATNKTLVWTSSSPDIISVQQDGSITALGLGSATITATASNGVSESIQINAQTEILVQNIVFSKSSITLKSGHSQNLSLTYTPANATNKVISWQSSNLDVVSVDENGKIVAKQVGSATITATTSNNITATCNVTVPVIEPINLMISVDHQKVSKLEIGDTYQIECSYYPSDVTYPIVWRSSNDSIVSVDQTGKITVHAIGNVVIYATLSSIERAVIINIYQLP